MISRYVRTLAATFIMLVAAFTWSGTAHATTYATTPTAAQGHDRWRIGYVESGDYVDYPLTLAEIADGLELLGWLSYTSPRPEGLSGPELWKWLARNIESDWLEF